MKFETRKDYNAFAELYDGLCAFGASHYARIVEGSLSSMELCLEVQGHISRAEMDRALTYLVLLEKELKD